MFEITDEFLQQAGFDALPAEQMERLRKIAAGRMEAEFKERIAGAISEKQSEEIERLIDGDESLALSVATRTNAQFRESKEFLAIQQLGRQNNTTDDKIIQQFALFSWFKEKNINVERIIRESAIRVMNDLRSTLSQVNEMADSDGLQFYILLEFGDLHAKLL